MQHQRILGMAIGILLLVAPLSANAQSVGIAAIVNDTIITTTDVAERRDILRAFSGAPQTPAANLALTRQALVGLMNEALQDEEAKRLSIEVPEEDIQAAMARIERARGREPGSLERYLDEANLSGESLKSQLRSQVAWNKVVTRRLRRNVTISDDEIARAQQAEANKAGMPHVQIAAIAIPIMGEADADRAASFARSLRARLIEGETFNDVARSLVGREDIRLNPSIWVPEESLEPSIAAVIRTLQAGQVTEPLRSLNTFQIVQMQDRRLIKPAAPETEVALKRITLSLDGTRAIEDMETLMDIANMVRANPGDCVHATVAGIEDMEGLKMDVAYLRTQLADVAEEMLPTVSALRVQEVSSPFVTRDGLQMLMLCEKMEPAVPLPDEEIIRQALFEEKIELEAEKHLRNLKRDAFIDVKLNANSTL